MIGTVIGNRKIVTTIILIALAVFQSCTEECAYKPRSLAGIDFHSVTEGTDLQTPVNLVALSGIGREDSLLYANRTSIQAVSLPLNGSAGETAFVFVFEEAADTVWFYYNVIPWFLSQECGFVLNFDLMEATHTTNMIDSVVIVISEITGFDDTNIRIYH